MSKMNLVRNMLREVLTTQRSKKKYMVLKDAVKKIKGKVSDVDVYRTVYQIGLNSNEFDIVHDETNVYIKLA